LGSLEVLERHLDGAATESPLNYHLLYRQIPFRDIELWVDWAGYERPIGSYVPS